MIELKHLHKTYHTGRANKISAVQDVSLELPEQGMIAIFGRSGCGKTTLLNCIGGLDRADTGSVLLDGKSVTPSANEVRNRHVGYIFQNYNLSKELTVFENVAVSLRLCGMTDEAEIERRVMAALESVRMEKYRKRLPDALSGGQQQRVAIARAIVKNPRVILADEPTGNLDEQNTVLVMDLLREIAKEHLVLLVTHEARLVDLYCDRVIEMGDGRVIQSRENAVTEGFSGKGAGDIYLGDLEKQQGELGDAVVEYYGDPAVKPTRLRLICVDGTLYIKADSDQKIKLLDHTTEAKIHEGKYEERAARDVQEFPAALREPIPDGKTGRMYDLRGAIKSGFRANFKGLRRGRKLLIAGLFCFAVIVVTVLGVLGTVFDRLQNIEQYYSESTVFVNSEKLTAQQAAQLREEIGAAHLFAQPYSYWELPTASEEFYFSIGNFETFTNEYSGYFGANGILLPQSAGLAEKKAIAGTTVLENETQMIISRGFADRLLKDTGVHYMQDYEDLLYIVGKYQTWGSGVKGQTVVGITDESEAIVYMHDYAYVQSKLGQYFNAGWGYVTDMAHAPDGTAPLERGEIYVSTIFTTHGNLPAIGDTVSVCGQVFTVKGVLDVLPDFDAAEFEVYVCDRYGVNIFESKEFFCEWWYGANFYNYSEWLEYYGEYATDYEADIAEAERAYTHEYNDVLSDYLASFGEDFPCVVLNEADLLTLTASLEENAKAKYTLLEPNMRREAYYAFFGEDVEALSLALIEKFGDGAVYTPRELHEYFVLVYATELISVVIVVAVIIAVMCLCLYFIMRSSLMSDIKSVGVCRAIGVSRKNLLFRYFVESVVLFSLTVLLGYLVASAALIGLGSLHATMVNILYYPWWLALLTLGGLVGVCVLFGIAPILSLLRRTPAEILAKYDI